MQPWGAEMKANAYTIIRGFACDALREHLHGTGARALDDTARASQLLAAGLGAAETAAAGMLYYAAMLRHFDGTARPDERAALAQHARTHAQMLAAYLPERQAAELMRVIDQEAPTAPAGKPEAAPAAAEPSRQARRLARLRELGGDRKRIAGQWQTTGTRGAFGALVAEERAAGRRPFDAKGVRRDIQAAAELERAGKVPGPFEALAR